MLGINSWPLGLEEPLALMRKVSELGLDGLQYCGETREQDPRRLGQLAEEFGLALMAIDPFHCAPPSPEQASEQGAIDYYRSVIDFAVSAGSPWVTIQGLGQWTANCRDHSHAWQRLLQCCASLEKHAAAAGVRLVYEVCNRYEVPIIRTLDACLALLEEADCPRIGVVLDSFHMNIDESDACAAIRRAGGRLASYQISDSNRAGIGSGHVDFVAQWRALQDIGFDGPVVLELVLPELTPSTPPQSAEQWARMNEEIARSARVWRALQRSA